jgi:hypothetical protein
VSRSLAIIDYGPFQLASPPRTATTWFERAAFLAGFNRGVNQHAHVHKPPLDNYGLMVTLVRHPYDWLDSYFHELKGGFCGVAEIDVLVPIVRESTSFNQFLREYLKRFPGFLGSLVRLYNPTTILRVEDLPWSAVELFGSLGATSAQLQEIVVMAPKNSRLIRYNGNGSDAPLRKAVCDAEEEYCDMFNYYPWKMR